MENKNWIGISVVSLLVILSSIGYVITDHTFYCQEKGIVIECLRFSSSGLRCYPSLTSNTGYKDCNDWTKLKTEDINKLLKTEPIIEPEPIPTYSGNARQYCCGKSCIKFNGNTDCE